MNGKSLHFIFFFIILCTSCGSYRIPYVDLSPESSGPQALDNVPNVELEKDDLFLSVQFLQSTEYDLLFDVAIRNETEDSVRIAPHEFQYFVLNPDDEVVASQYAFHPDDIVFELQESIEQDRKAVKTAKTMGWVFFGLNAIAASVSLATDNPDIAANQLIDGGINLAVAQIEGAAIKKHIVGLEGELQYYDNAAMREMTLAPGEEVDGLLIFPRWDDARRLAFEFEIEDCLFEITYKQDWRREE